MEARDAIERSETLLAQIRPILSGEGPEVQGATLAALLAAFVAGHAPDIRYEQLDILAAYACRLVPVEVEGMIMRGVAPEEWRDPVRN